MAKAKKYHRDLIKLQARSGFSTAQSLNRRIKDIVDDELDGDKHATAELRLIATTELAKLAAAEKTWKTATINDRIDAAFADLDRRGIVALQNAGYTMSDGWTDANEVASDRTEPRGATFYHGQDLERGVAGAGLMLAFGAYVDGKQHVAASIAVAQDIVATLERFGVPVEWDGSNDTRISIKPFKWKRRMKTRAPKLVAARRVDPPTRPRRS